MSKSEFDQNDNQGNASMFDFLSEDTDGQSIRRSAAKKRKRKAMPVIRQPVHISKLGPLLAPKPGDPVSPPPPLTTGVPVEADAGKKVKISDDLDFLDETHAEPLDLRPAKKKKQGTEQSHNVQQLPAANSNDETQDLEQEFRHLDVPNRANDELGFQTDRHARHASYEDVPEETTSGWLRKGSLAAILIAGVAVYAYTSGYFDEPKTTTDVDGSADGLAFKPTGESSVSSDFSSGSSNESASTTTETAASSVAGGSSLSVRFREQLAAIQAMVGSGSLEDAEQALKDLDRSVYGYGAAEFSELENRIASIRGGQDNTAELAELAEADRVEQLRLANEAALLAERLEEEARIAEATETERLQEQARIAEAAETERLQEQARIAKAAETERLREEARIAEAAETERLREEARIAEAAEAERLQEQARIAEAAETDRLREEARIAEAAELERLQEEARAAETARLEQARIEAERTRLAQLKINEETAAAEAARIREETRIAEAVAAEVARLEQARIEAEQRRLAQARFIEEKSAAEASRLEQEARIAKAVAAETARLDQVRIDAETASLAQAKINQEKAAAEASRIDQARLKQLRESEAAGIAASEAEKIRLDALEEASREEARRQIVSADKQATDRRISEERAAAQRQTARDARFKRAREIEAEKAAIEVAAAANAQNSSSQERAPAQVQSISDDELQFVYQRFEGLQNAISDRDISAVVGLTERSGLRVQQFMQVFENSVGIDVRLGNVSTSDATGAINGTLQIRSIQRNDGTLAVPPANLKSISISAKRQGDDWSLIRW